MIIAQISDFHVRCDGRLLKDLVDSEAALAAAVKHVNGLRPRPDVVLATGDLVNKARRRDYRVVRGILGVIKAQVFVIPGNNDDRERMRAVFGETGWLPGEGDFLHYTVEDLPLRLIGLDSVDAGRAEGIMCGERLRWLKARLGEQPERPTLLFMHHPPYRTGFACVDEPPFKGAEKLARVVAANPQVVHVMCGHVHRQTFARWAGTTASTAPSTAFQMALDLRPDVVPPNVLEPAGSLVFQWRLQGGLVAHPGYAGDFS